jgi:hypothetical protein
MHALKAGVSPESVRRPLEQTIVMEPEQQMKQQHIKSITQVVDFKAQTEKGKKKNVL